MNKVKSKRRANISLLTKRSMVSSCSSSGRNKNFKKQKKNRKRLFRVQDDEAYVLITKLTHIYNLGRISRVEKTSFVATVRTRMAFSMEKVKSNGFSARGLAFTLPLSQLFSQSSSLSGWCCCSDRVQSHHQIVSSTRLRHSINHVPYRTHNDELILHKTWVTNFNIVLQINKTDAHI